MIVRTTRVPSPFYSITIWPFIFILPEYAKDAALLAHEFVHYNEQRWITPWWWLKYALSKRFRIAAEVRAYKVQIDMGMRIGAAGYWLMKYDKNMTFKEAVALLGFVPRT
jgi:hypothetical protein